MYAFDIGTMLDLNHVRKCWSSGRYSFTTQSHVVPWRQPFEFVLIICVLAVNSLMIIPQLTAGDNL